MINWVKDRVDSIINFITDHLLSACLLLCIPLCILARMLPLKRMELVPHVITYGSCNLAMIGIIFSVLLGMRTEYIHKKMTQCYPDIAQKMYWKVFYVTVASISVILLSMLILSIETWSCAFKLFMNYALFVAFVYMVWGTVFLLFFFTQLMIRNDELNAKANASKENLFDQI
ncbi:MAG: hypothetical protein J6K32_05380 [Clostridia bacterium]|nr:hypothetical protein [Clostridia bacterium]